jgi:serine/threonine protein kinase
MSSPKCPNEQELREYSLGKLKPDCLETVAQHLEQCLNCQLTLSGLEDKEDTLVSQIRHKVGKDVFAEEAECRDLIAIAKNSWHGARKAQCAAEDVPTADWERSGILGEYQLFARLGEGGMGCVFMARHTRLDRIVAIKVLAKDRTADPQYVARFEREMKAIGRLVHPNIVHAYDARDIEGTSVLVMEYIEGLDLADLSHRVGMPAIADVCEMVRQTAMGLQYVHEHGFVHRDVKPSNIMLTREGQIKILDLGLALLAYDNMTTEGITSTGHAMGTADYMAPEQIADSHAVDIRADIYSLGCTLYKLLCGRPPFSGPAYDTPGKRIVAHIKEPVPPIQQFRPDIPVELAKLLDRMLAKDPADRPATPLAVAEALKPFVDKADLVGFERKAEECDPADYAHQPTIPNPIADAVPSLLNADAGNRGGTNTASNRIWRRWLIAIGTGIIAFGLLAAIITVATDHGILEIKTFDDDVLVSILDGGHEILIVDTKTSNTVKLKSGNYEVKLNNEKDGLRLSTDKFTLRRGERVVVEVLRKTPEIIPGQELSTVAPGTTEWTII